MPTPRFSKKNVLIELEKLIANWVHVRGSSNWNNLGVLPQDSKGVAHMEQGQVRLMETVLDELRLMKGPLSRVRWIELLKHHVSLANTAKAALSNTGVFDPRNEYAQCRGEKLAVWEWYGYFRQANWLMGDWY